MCRRGDLAGQPGGDSRPYSPIAVFIDGDLVAVDGARVVEAAGRGLVGRSVAR
jgi:hypothetical protein